MTENLESLIRYRGTELDISTATFHRILIKYSHFHYHRMQLVTGNHAERKEFTDWLIEQQKLNADFVTKPSSATRLSFISIASLIGTIAAFGAQ